jgi:hypothetical protein
MFSINTNLSENLRERDAYNCDHLLLEHPVEDSLENLSSYDIYSSKLNLGTASNDEDLISLNSAGHATEETAEDHKHHELKFFNLMKWGHLGAFLLIPFTFYLKSKGWYNTKQFI